MTRLLGVALALICAACTSGPAAPTSRAPATSAPPAATRTPTFPSGPLALVSCGAVEHLQDGNVRPILCPDGHPSQAAASFFRAMQPSVSILDLGAGATLADVRSAMCADKRLAHMTNPMEASAYVIRAVEVGWRYGWQPIDGLNQEPC